MIRVLFLMVSMFFVSCLDSVDYQLNRLKKDKEDKILELSTMSPDLIDNGAKIEIVDGETYDFGNIARGESAEIEFTVRNTGSGDLIISDINTSCGCTNPIWSKDRIPQGESSKIWVTFDSKGREGKQIKTITLVTNDNPSIQILTITGNVIDL